jgi:hypothetical protein
MAQWVRSLDLTTHTSLLPIRRGFAPGCVNYKKGALDSQSQVIKFTSCLVGGSHRVLRLPPPLKLVTMIYSWNIVEIGVKTPTINQSITSYCLSTGHDLHIYSISYVGWIVETCVGIMYWLIWLLSLKPCSNSFAGYTFARLVCIYNSLQKYTLTRLVCIYMNGIIQIKYSTILRSNPKYTWYHHKAYILSLKQQN